MTRYQDYGHEHCDKHCVRIGHGWGQCEGRGGERWHLKCPRCDERESILAELMDEYDPYEDVAVSAVLRIVGVTRDRLPRMRRGAGEVPLVFRDRVDDANNCLEVTITPEMSAVRDHAEKHRQEDDYGDDG